MAAKVLERFALQRGEDEIGDSAPSLYEPLELRPLVRLSDDLWLLHLAPPKLGGALRPNLESVLKTTGLWGRYERRRREYVETQAVAMVVGVSPHARGWTNLAYEFDDGNGLTTYELDGLVLVDNVCFLVEAKAGALRLASRRGAPGATKDDIRSLVAEAHEQALRARRFIEHADEVRFDAGEQGVPLRGSRIQEFILLTVSLDVLSSFVTRTYDLVETGLLSASQMPWPVALAELEIICDLCNGMGQLVHYVRRRLSLNKRDIHAAEELDWFGNYLEEGLFFEGGEFGKADHLYVGDFASRINAYYESRHDVRLQPAPRPVQQMPAPLADLVAQLESQGPDGFVDAIGALLDGDGAARKRLAEGVADASEKVRRMAFAGFRMHMSHQLVVLAFSDADSDQRLLDAYVIASKYAAKAARAVGIGRFRGGRMLVRVADFPWRRSAAEQAAADAFLAQLNSRTERPNRRG